MSEEKCTECGFAGETNDKWLKCPKCHYSMCPECRPQEQKEQNELEKVRTGDPYERMSALCPSCMNEIIFRVI